MTKKKAAKKNGTTDDELEEADFGPSPGQQAYEAHRKWLEDRLAELETAPQVMQAAGVRSARENGAKRTQELEELFLGWLAKGYTPKTAAAKIGVSRTTVFNWKADPRPEWRPEGTPSFTELWVSAVDEGTDVFEEEARRRAIDGVDEPVFQQGECVGFMRKYSDTLLVMMLKGRRPETYRDRQEITGANGGPVALIGANMNVVEASQAYAAMLRAPASSMPRLIAPPKVVNKK